jgi:hypothetical protein
MASAPKLFISYSWTSENHESWIIKLATALRQAGVDVVLDKWDLREGQDAHAFMEQMVSNTEIKKVAMICDRKYAEKANDRAGGVGTETQIISPELYARQDQTKFVAVLSERDADGRPFLPVYYRSRVYIDLSSEELYAGNFEQLLRWVYDKPLHVKPDLGEKPGFLSDEPKPSLGTTAFLQRAVDAIRNTKSHRSAATSEYLERLAGGFNAFRVAAQSGKEFDDVVMESIDAFTPYRNEAIELFLLLAAHGPTTDDLRALHRFFEQVFPFMHTPENVSTYMEWDYDNYRFIVHELFLYLIASLLRHERFGAVAQLVRQPYYVGRHGRDDGAVPFAEFREYLKSFDHRNRRLQMRRLSLRGDLLTKRIESSGLSVEQIMQADFTLFIRDCLDSIRNGDQRQGWWPETLLYLRSERAFEIFARAQSRQYFDEIKILFDIKDKSELEPLFQAFREQKLRIPRWEFQSFDPALLLGYERLASKP